MTREEIEKLTCTCSSSNILLELPTGMGKTYIALKRLKSKKYKRILIVVPTINLINNWKKEFRKFRCLTILKRCEFTCYNSIHKYTKYDYDCIVFDEAHHISPLVIDKLNTLKFSNSILLSATIPYDKMKLLYYFKGLHIIKETLQSAMENDILPTPKIKYIPLELDDTVPNLLYIIKKGKGKILETTANNKFKALSLLKGTTNGLGIRCTEKGYYDELTSAIAYYKDKYKFANLYSKLCRDRLMFLSNLKTELLKDLQYELDKDRTLIFCNSIKQAKEISNYAINSKDKHSIKYIEAFNSGKINHITSVNMLNEGINLVNLNIIIFGVINASEIMTVQKIGRVLRTKNPVIYIPYYTNTREEVLIQKL